MGCGQNAERGVEVAASDGDVGLDLIGGSGSVLDAGHGGTLAQIGDVGAGQAIGGAGQLGGQPVGRQRWSQLQAVEVVFKYVGAPALVGKPHPHHLVETPWAAQGRIDVLGAVGGSEDEDLAALFNAVEQDQQLRHHGHLVLGTFGGARRSDAVNLVEQDDCRCELLSALEDLSDCRFGLADPFGQESRAVHDLNVGAALASHGAREESFPRARRAGEDDAVAEGFGANAEEQVGVLERQLDQVARGFDGGILAEDIGIASGRDRTLRGLLASRSVGRRSPSEVESETDTDTAMAAIGGGC